MVTRAEHEAGRVSLRANIIALNRRKHTQMSTYCCPHLKEIKKKEYASQSKKDPQIQAYLRYYEPAASSPL
jgi:hypothetical protein